MISASYGKWKMAAYLMIVVHLLLVILHAAAHQILAVDPSALQLSFILVVIMGAPVVGGLLLWKFDKAGAILLTFSMAGSLLFGVYNHFIGHSIDHVAEVARLQPEVWSKIFQVSAVCLAISEAGGTLIGVWLTAIRRPRLETQSG